MKTIIGISKKVKYKIFVDDEDFERLKDYKWNIRIAGNNKYARRWFISNNKLTWVSMHREIMNIKDERVVDHKDHNALNNQKSNLRVCTKSENNKNRTSKRGSSSKYLGVCVYNNKEVKFSKRKNEFYTYERIRIEAAICINGKGKRIGYFKTEEEAAIAYNKAAIKHHGEFANLNKVGGYHG